MRIVFFGTPEFGAVVLQKLVEAEMKPVLAVTTPDKPVGRKQVITPPPVKSLIMKHETWNIPVLQPEKLDSGFRFQVSRFTPDVMVLAAYGQIVPKDILDMPKFGALNVHPSLLPKYRGPSPIQTALLQGEEKTGVTIMLMDEEIDHGPILAQREWEITNPKYQIPSKSQIPITKMTYLELQTVLAKLGGDLLVDTIPGWVQGEIVAQEQDHSQATYTSRIQKEDGKIDWQKSAEYVERQIQALHPWPGTYTLWQGKMLKILEGRVQAIPEQHSCLEPGTVIPWKKEFAVMAKEGVVVVEQLQLEGKKPVLAKDFLLGHKDFLGSVLA